MTGQKVTYRKWNGDDIYSWAVFINGVVVPSLTGLNLAQARYYKQLILDEKSVRR